MSDTQSTVAKTNGKTLKAFYAAEDYWGDRYQDDAIFVVNGKTHNEGLETNDLLDTDQVEIQYGYVIDPSNDESEDLVEFFRKWAKAQNSVPWLIDVPKGQEEAVKAALAALGCTVN